MAAAPVWADSLSRAVPPRKVRATQGTSSTAAFSATCPDIAQTDVGSVVVMDHDGTDYSWKLPDGSANYDPRGCVAQRFYRTHSDAYDFIVVFTNFEFETGQASAFYNLVRNDVRGTGKPLADNGWLFGSPGRLKGYIDMAALTRWVPPSGVFNPGDPAVSTALHTLAHEVGHQWLAEVRFRDAAGAVRSDLLGRDGSHWSYLLDSDASHMYGSDWADLGSGHYRAERIRESYSPLDLYLMGLLPAERTPAFTLLRAPSVDATGLPVEGAEVEATADTVSISDVIAAEGVREPDAQFSQKEFRLGFVLLVRPGSQPTTAEILAVERLRDLFQAHFFVQTHGVAVADTTLAEAPPEPPLPTIDLEGAITWLLAHQSADGRWEDVAGSGVRDTSLALETLAQLGRTGTPIERGAGWVDNAPAPNTDFVARRIVALAQGPLSSPQRASLREVLLRSRNADGGFGPGPGYASTAIDTALALRALRALNDTPGGAVNALAALEAPGGGFGVASGRGVSTVVTAEVVLALLDWPEEAAGQPLLSRALLTLLARRNPDGGFGESPSTTYATALALRALSRAGVPQAQLVPAIAWLKAAQRPDRSFGGSRYETALALSALRLTLGGNLVVAPGSLSIAPSSPQEGEQVRVTAAVRNAGSSPVGATHARLFDGAPGTGEMVAEASVPALDAGAQATVELDFDTTDRAGLHTLYVVADGRNEIEEAREDDNSASLALRVEGLLADLQLASVAMDPNPATVGETAVVGVTLRNLGAKRNSGTAILRLVLGDPRQGGRVIGDVAIPSVEPGATTLVTFAWDTTGSLGEYALYALADATYLLAESDESNNEAMALVEVVQAPPAGAELSIPAFTAEPGELSTVPQTVELRVSLKNRGLTGVSTRVVVLDKVSGQQLVDLPVVVGPRATVPIVHPLTIEAPGTRQLEAAIDPDNTIVEEKEDDNRAATIIVDRQNTVDLELSPEDVVPSATDLLVGETLSVAATVHNRGTATVQNVPVVLARSTADGGAELARQVVPSVAPGAAVTATLSWKTGVTGSPLGLLVKVDPFAVIPEVSESNNDVALALTVRASSQPNLHVSGADVTLDPDPPLEGGNATIRVRVTNPSVVEAPANVLAVYLGDPDDGGTQIGQQPVPVLVPGGQAVVAVPWSSVRIDGVTGLFAVVDAEKQVGEFDETDNVAFRPVSLIRLPDLALGMGDVTLAPAFPHGGEAVQVTAIVRNLGAQASTATVLRIFEGEAGDALIAERPIPPLLSGASAEVTAPWSASGLGAKLLTVVVDPDGGVAEGDEGNNQARHETVVQDADLFLTAPYFSPDGDGSRDETVLAWRASGPVDVVISNRSGTKVRTLAQAAPAEGTVAWNGRDDGGVLLPDGDYTLSLRAPGGALLRRIVATLDTNRLAIHEAAGTGRISTRNMTCTLPDVGEPAWTPSEDAALFVRSWSQLPDFPPGLLRVGIEGDYEYLVQDPWYAGAKLPGSGAVSPDGRTVLVRKGNELHGVDLLTGERTLLVVMSYSDGEVRWSPDGQRLAVGQELFERDGRKLGDLPGYGRWSWSPDGQHLTLGFTVVSIDDLANSWRAPFDGARGPYASYVSTEWRSDGTVFTLAYDSGKSCLNCNVQCENGCAVVYRPYTDEVRQLPWLPARAHSWTSVDWAPSADRVLYQRTRPPSFEDVTEVAAENGSQRLQLMGHGGEVSSRKSVAYYWSGEAAEADGACYSPGTTDLFAVRSLDNLSVDFHAATLPGNSGVLFVGVAADRNLEGWQLEYATTAAPATWHAITPASDAPVLDDVLTAWVPPAPGAYAVRLTVRDLGGNTRTRTRVLTWNHYPSIRNITQSEFLISPNADDFKDAVRFDYFVVEPTHLEVRIVGPQASGPGTPPVVRRFSLDYSTPKAESFVWDGRDEQGQVVPDGRYQAYLNEVPLRVDVDNTPPDVAFKFRNLHSACCDPQYGLGTLEADRVWHVVDANLKNWSSPSEQGTWPQYDPLRDVNGEVLYDEQGRPVVHYEAGHPADLVELIVDLGTESGLSFSATDRGGNHASVPVPAVPEKLFVLGATEPVTERVLMSPPIDPQRIYGLEPTTRFFVAETITDTPPGGERLRLQYRPDLGGAWQEEQEQKAIRDFQALGLDLGEAYRGRFVCDAANGHGQIVSEEFRFRACDRHFELLSELRDTEAGVVIRFNVTSSGADLGVEARLTFYAGSVLVFDGPLTQVAPGQFQSKEFPAPPKCPGIVAVARVRGASGKWYEPSESVDDGRQQCIRLKLVAGCNLPAGVEGRQLRRSCSESDPNRTSFYIVASIGLWTKVEALARGREPVTVLEFRSQGDKAGSVDVTGLPHGELPMRVSGSLDPGTEIVAEHSFTLFVDRAPPVGEVLQPAESAVLCVGPDPNTGREAVSFVVTAVDDAPLIEVSAELKREGGNFQPVSRVCPPEGCGEGLIQTGEISELKWDVTLFPDGNYTARITFCDRAGNRSTVERLVSLNRDGPNIRVVNAVRSLFSPNGDGRADVTSFGARLAQAVELTARVHAGRDATGPLVHTLFTERSLPQGDHGVAWDGRTDTGAVVPDGVYTIALRALDPCGREGGVNHLVEVDNNPPVVLVAQPGPGSTVTSSLDVRGVAYDKNMARHDLAYSTENIPPTIFASGFSSVGNVGFPTLLSRWVVPNGSGPVTLRLHALDRAENEAEATVDVVREAPFRLGPLRALPALFSPNGDGRRETTTLEYTLLSASRVSVSVVGPGSAVVRQLLTGVVEDTGLRALSWDGRSDTGAAAPDGEYIVRLTAETPEGGGAVENAEAAVIVDRTPPAVLVASPAAGAFVERDASATGSVQDLRLDSFVVTATPAGGLALELARGSENQPAASSLASLSTLEEGPHTLTVDAEDQAENRTHVTRDFAVDSLPPLVAIHTPSNGAVLLKSAVPIEVTGAAVDENLDEWVMELGRGSMPAFFGEMRRSPTGGHGIALGPWVVAGLVDDAYTLRLRASDRAEHTAETRVRVELDGTPPVAALRLPAEGQCLRVPTAIEGTASDLHLVSWELESAPGPAGTAYQWTPLDSGTTAVDNARLVTWAPLPPDGVHTLRLTVRDAVDLSSSVLRTVTIDTVAPASSVGLQAEIKRTGAPVADIVLHWTAVSDPAVAGYRVERDTVSLAPPPVSTTFTDPARPEGTYVYKVTTVDACGNASEPASVTVRVDLSPPLVDILRPTESARVSGSVDIRGTAWSAPDFKEYRLFVGAGAEPDAWTLLRRSASPVQGGVLGTWTALGEGTYTFRLEAEDTSGNQAQALRHVIVDNNPPEAPVLTSVERPDPTTEHLSWLKATWVPVAAPDTIGYLVYRNGRLANVLGIVIGDLRPYLVPAPSHVDQGLPDGEHCYHVIAMDEAGNLSPPSNQLCKTLDNRPPHALIIQPADGSRFQFPLRVAAFTPDTDVVRVQFQYRAHDGGVWLPLGAPDTQEPWETTLDPETLIFGPYEVQAVATDASAQTDPEPEFITVVYGDVTAPAPPLDLRARADERRVSLAWAPSPETDVVGYHVYREGVRLTETRVPDAAYLDERDPGRYAYTVTAVDGEGNESQASNEAVAQVYQLTLDESFPVTLGTSAALVGGGAHADTTIDLLREGNVAASAPATGDRFQVPGVALVPEGNVFVAQGRDAQGDRSVASNESVLISNTAPAVLGGLIGSVNDHDVSLDWDAAPETDLFGYALRRDTEALTPTVPQTEASSITASSSIASYYGPEQAFDGLQYTVWLPSPYGGSDQSWSATFPQRVLIERVEIDFVNGYLRPAPPLRYRIEALWEGRYVPLVQAAQGSEAQVQHTFPWPFATEGLRVVVGLDGEYHGISEIRVFKQDLVPSSITTFLNAGAPDGHHTYEAAAVDRYGAYGPWAAVQTPVGDAEPPARPSGLACTTDGSDAVLVWNASAEPDFEQYSIVRGASVLSAPGTPAYRDVGLANGTYTYTVRAVDAVGNESAFSEPATCTIAVEPPVAPVLRAEALSSGVIRLDWDHPGAPEYVISRSLVTGGPYSELGSVAQRELLDTTATYGVRHFYVAHARDAQGRPSPLSNEASAVPKRTDPPAAPVIVFPTDAANPTSIQAFHTPVAGRTDAGTRVTLSVDGQLRGEVESHPAFAPQLVVPVPSSSAQGKLSPDARYLAYSVDGVQWIDLATRVLGRYADPDHSSFKVLGFAPDSRRILYSALTTSAPGRDLFWLDLRDGTTQPLETGLEIAQDASWSPDGSLIAIAVTASDEADGRVQLYEVATGSTRTLFEGSGWVGGLAWSPDSSQLAFTHGVGGWSNRDSLVQSVAGGSPRALGLLGTSDLQWLADGSGFVFTDPSSGENRVRRYDLTTGTASDLAPATLGQHSPRVDPGGRWVTFLEFDDQAWRTYVVAHELSTGVRRTLAQDEAGGAPSSVGWSRNGHLGLVRPDSQSGTGQLELLPGFDSGFGFESLRLHPGRNTLVAQAADPVSGLVSTDSLPVHIDAPLEIFPDLEVTAADLGAYPALPQAGQSTSALARVRNVGVATAHDVEVHLTVSDPTGATLAEVRPVIFELAAGQTVTVSAPWRPQVTGTYGLHVRVDEPDTIGETREDNNVAARSLPVAGAGLLVTLDSDRTSYLAQTSALVTASVTNGGGPFSGRARLYVAEAQGQEVALLSERAVSLAYAARLGFDARWNTGTTYAGPYTFELRLSDASGAPAGSATRPFTIVPDVRVGAGLRSAATRVPQGAAAAFHGSVSNLGANAPLSNLLARLVILPEGSDIPVFESAEVPLPTLVPQAGWEHDFDWPVATPLGPYHAEMRVGLAGAAPLVVAQAPFEVVEGVITVGTLEAVPTHVVVGASFEARFTVTNLSAGAMSDYPVTVEAVSGTQATAAAGQSATLSLQPGQTVPGVFTFSSTSLAPGPYSLRLRGGGPAVTLARASVRVHGLLAPPSIHAPQDGSTVDAAHPLLVVNNATSTEGAALSYEFELYGNPSLGLALPGRAGVSETAQRTAWRVTSTLTEDHVYYWRARASDGFSKSAWSAVASFRLDAVNLPPQAPVPDSPAPGARVTTLQPTLLVADAMDPENDVLTYDFKLGTDPALGTVLATAAGLLEGPGLTPWMLPLLLDEHVTYWWSARAFDGHSYSPWSPPVSFLIDLANDPPSAPVPRHPIGEERAQSLTPQLLVTNAADPEGDTLTYRFEIDTVASFNSPDLQVSSLVREGLDVTDWVAPAPLRDNTRYYWRAAATDGGLFGPWGTASFFVDLVNEPPGPPLALDPVDGRTVPTHSPTLLVRNAVDPENDPLTYEFEVRDAGNAVVAGAGDVGSGALESSWLVAPELVEDRAYTWSARARDSELFGPWSVPAAFRVNAVIAPPTAPTRIAPPECGTVAARRPDLVIANASSADGLALTYTFELYSVGTGGALTLVDQALGLPEGLSSTTWRSGIDLADGRYSWRARATDTVPQVGPWMDSACFYVAVDVPPAAPLHLVAAPGDARVTLDWNASPEPDVVRYSVYRSLTPGGPYAPLADSTTPHLVDSAVSNGTTYYYVVTARDVTFESGYSNEAGATPQGSDALVAEVRFTPVSIQGECVLSHGCCDASHSAVQAAGAKEGGFGPEESATSGASSTTVSPVLECVADNMDGSFSAFFGTNNTSAMTMSVPVGAENYFSPAPQNRGQPTTLAPGRTSFPAGAFEAVFDGGSLSWKLKGASATASSHSAACSATAPRLDCPVWFNATIELPLGRDPHSISLSSLRLAGVVRADLSYARIVDTDTDGRNELEVRFAFQDLAELLSVGVNTLILTGKADGHDFQGVGTVVVDAPRVSLWFTPRTLKRSAQGTWVEAQLLVSDCLDVRDIDTASLLLNENVRIDRVVTRNKQKLIVKFKRSAVAAVLPNGTHVEVRVSGRFLGHAFVARDYIRVTP